MKFKVIVLPDQIIPVKEDEITIRMKNSKEVEITEEQYEQIKANPGGFTYSESDNIIKPK